MDLYDQFLLIKSALTSGRPLEEFPYIRKLPPEPPEPPTIMVKSFAEAREMIRKDNECQSE